MSPGRRPSTRWILAAVAAGLVLRLVVATCFSKYTTGDEIGYVERAGELVSGADVWARPDAFSRPPGMLFYVAAVLGLAGNGSVVAVRVANALVASSSIWLLARVARRAMPWSRRAPVVAAWVQALNPLDLRTVQWVMSENVATPLVLCVVLAALAVARRPTWRRAAAFGGVTGVLMLVRVDCAIVALSAGLGGLAWRWRRRGVRRAAWTRWIAAGAVAALVCVPWSAFVSARRGHASFVIDGLSNPPYVERIGWDAWLTNVDLPRKDWLRIYWWGAHDLDPSWIPDSVYADDAERAEIGRLVARDQAAHALLPEVDAEFARIGAERRRASPFRFHVVLPTLRTLNIWFHPTDDDIPRHMEPVRRSLPSWALEIALRIARPLAGIGFLLAVAALLRPRLPTAVLGGAVVGRTVLLVYGVPLVTGLASYEGRYMAVVQPLALLLLAGAVVTWIERRRRAVRGGTP